MTIRIGGPEDRAQVAALAAGAGFASWPAAALEETAASPGAVLLVAGAPAEVEGFVLGRELAGEVEVLLLTVTPAARRRGLGRQLVEALVAWGAGRGGELLHLEVAEDNRGARSFYERLGFREVGRRRGYYASGEAAVPLARPLEP